MPSEVATLNESSIDLLPPARPMQHSALANLDEQVQAMAKAHHIAKVICGSSMGGRFRGKPDDGAVAILYGAEVGLNPQQAMHKVVVVHGMPTLEARTMVALLKRQGYRIRVTEQSDDSVSVQGIDHDGDVFESTWTIDRAIRAGYVPTIDERTGKYKTNQNGKLIGNEKYLTDPQAMLKAKAQAEVCRDMAPDVLLGISYTREELESERWDDSALQSAPTSRSSAAVTVDEIMGNARVVVPEPEYAEEVPDAEVVADGYDTVDPEPANAEPTAEPVAADPEPIPEAVPGPAAAEPEQPAKPKTAKRKALEKRLFPLLGLADISADKDREDRIIVYRDITKRPDVTSTDDLTDDQVSAVADQLFAWDQAGELADQITDILNSAALAEEAATTTTTEGK